MARDLPMAKFQRSIVIPSSAVCHLPYSLVSIIIQIVSCLFAGPMSSLRVEVRPMELKMSQIQQLTLVKLPGVQQRT